MDFLTAGNIAGQTLLRLVSRGSSIIAELLRLSHGFVPPAVRFAALAGDDAGGAAAAVERDPRAARYRPVLYDFRYLKTPEMFNQQLNTSAELTDLDEEFFDAHAEVLGRFYVLFESIFTYMGDYNKFLRELEEGYFIQYTLEAVLLDVDGRQLLCEGLYLYGVMLLMMDCKLPGPVRERLIVAQYRHKGEGATVPIVELSRLCRDSGFRGAGAPKRPAAYPEDFLGRFPVEPKVVSMIINRLRSDDIYGMSRIYSAAEHRSSALASQASLLYVALYFSPKTLHEGKAVMREVVDKHFSDHWVVPLYMGERADLSLEWERYRAAKEALTMEDALTVPHVKALVASTRASLAATSKAIDATLVEGVLSETYVVDNIGPLLETVKAANMALRWVMLHRRCEVKKWRDLVCAKEGGFGEERPLLDFLLRTSQLEYRLKAHIKHLLGVKDAKWAEDKAYTGGVLRELSEYFSGARALTRVERDEGLQTWFAGLSAEVAALDYADGVLAGRKMRQLVRALDEVLQFDIIDATPQVKDYLLLARERITEMVRSCAISDLTLADLNTLSDFAYAWELIQEFTPEMHARISNDPAAVRPLRATVLKLTSTLDAPIMRITQAGSPDLESVAQYYSNELVGFLRKVMGVIPVIVFAILRDAITLQSTRMRPLPVKLEATSVREYAQPEARALLAKKTHEISIFTEGVLAMDTTLLGVIKVDPRQILTDGIRKHLVDQICGTLHGCLSFDMRVGKGRDPKASLASALRSLSGSLAAFKQAFEYVQDYIRVYGLRMWQEELTRCVGFAVEQECNRFVKKLVPPGASAFQTLATPLPLNPRAPPGDVSPTYVITFMGRLAEALLALTRPTHAQHGPGPTGGGWYDPAGRELAGVGLFVALNGAVGVPGLTGLDRIFGFTAERELSQCLRAYAAELKAGADETLGRLAGELAPPSATAPALVKRINELAATLRKPLEATAERLVGAGHAQLLRRAIAHELRFSCRLESNFLCGAVEAVNEALLGDIRRHYFRPEAHALPSDENPLLANTAQYCEATGINDPLANVYVTPEGSLQAHLGMWLTLVAVVLAPRLVWDAEMGNLVRRGLAGGGGGGGGGGLPPPNPNAPPAQVPFAYPLDTALDGAPLVCGFVTLLKQMHPAVTAEFVEALAQYVRSVVLATTGAAVSAAAGGSSSDAKAIAARAPALPTEVYALLVLLWQVARVARVPDRVLHAALPAYLVNMLPVGVSAE